jgi:GNAT superfamily N-acetyltransferase
MQLVRYADRPDLREIRHATLSGPGFPEFAHHAPVGNRWWGELYDRLPDFQLCLLDGGEPVAELHSAPLAWDGTLDDLPTGWDGAFGRAFTSGREPDVLCALEIAVRPDRRGERLSARMVETMRELARTARLRELIAPVRPTWKARYPLIPIERYLGWRRPDGAHFDPWIRLHERLGGEILAPAPESTRIEAPLADWEEWTGMAFPGDGDHVVPEMLAPLRVANGVGIHVEPNVWLRHRV